MNAMLIADEQKVLNLLNQKIKQLSNIEVQGAFTNHHQGLIEVSINQPDVLFLDISIPEVNWIKVARQLKIFMPEMKIIFLATVEQYAVDAFEVQVDDYLLKPIKWERLKQTIYKIEVRGEVRKSVNQPMIVCFEKLDFYDGDKDTLDVRWRTSKAREVFAYLVHKRRELIRKDVLVDLFWPEYNMKNGFSQLYSTIYQIRRSLAAVELNIQIISSESSYRLELNNCLVDVDVWEKGIQIMPLINAENIKDHKELLFLYKGAYFNEENYLWAINERERLRVKWINHMKRVVNYFYSIESYEEAILLYLYYQKINPYISDSYFELMKLYAHFDNHYAVEKQYHLLKEMFEEAFDEEPDDKIASWYTRWKKDR